RRNFPELVDELFASGDSPPAILVWVDAWTSLGGSQFIDSPGTGRYHTYIVDEIVPGVDEHYLTLPEAAHRGLAGKSSGGERRGRVRRDGQPDAAARRLRRARDPRRRRALRDVLPARLPALRTHAPRPVRRLDGAFLGGLPLPAGLLEGQRRHAPERLLHGRLLLGRRGRNRAAALRHRDRRAPRGRLGALAGVGPGSDGARARRCAALAARDLRGLRQARPVLPRPRRAGLRPRARRGGGRRLLLRAVRRDALGDRVPLPRRREV